MRQLAATLLMIVLAMGGKGQSCYPTELAMTEMSFALEAQLYGLRHGFMSYLDTAARGLNKNGFTSLYKIWKERQDALNAPALVWKPAYVYAGSAGLAGVSYGPYFTKTSADSALTHAGFFFTIWKRNSTAASYKIIFDSGVRFSKASSAENNKAQPVAISFSEDTAQHKNPAIYISHFHQQVAGQPLSDVLAGRLPAEGNVVVSNEGILDRKKILTSQILQQAYTMTTLWLEPVQNSFYVEYGTLSSKQKAGYYVHIWKHNTILSALYKFE